MGSITSANAVLMLSITSLFPAPQQLQGFAADDIFTTEDIQVTEPVMGVDGKLSAGFVNMPVPMSIAVQADSISNAIFDQWAAASKILQDVYFAQMTVVLTSLGRKWTCSNGTLTRYKPMPDAAKVLQPRRFGIVWETVLPANV